MNVGDEDILVSGILESCVGLVLVTEVLGQIGSADVTMDKQDLLKPNDMPAKRICLNGHRYRRAENKGNFQVPESMTTPSRLGNTPHQSKSLTWIRCE